MRGFPRAAGGHTGDCDACGGTGTVLAGDEGGGVCAEVKGEDGALWRFEPHLELPVVEVLKTKPHPLLGLPCAVTSALATLKMGA